RDDLVTGVQTCALPILEKGNPLGDTPLNAPFDVVAGDFNNDGHLDLAVTNTGSGNVSHSSGHAGDLSNFIEANAGSEQASENVRSEERRVGKRWRTRGR